ncbi:MAG TPA: aminotransferase class I/II-fold pyridoxal phosphate-dependent enzyme [Egicoccus sp.]|nr:aminotransferase class I/II-fold pyridoxal phosphate-dependent enzyme [Egicoccus sp.]HSK24501.1 aminotransferase class I/II-fold pyridoxal phosphate-dependent enzyme [Egicoccus sp.]
MRATEQPLVARMRGFGTTIFSEMTALAVANDAVNLGQGFPDEDPPEAMIAAATAAMRAGHNQYAPGPGVGVLRHAIADHQQRHHALTYDPDTEVSVTFGATEALAATLLAVCDPGDEVVVLEPTYDAYTAVLALVGATAVPVRLDPPGFTLDLDRFAAAITPRTRLVLLNSPHNPTGTVLDAASLDAIAELCVEHDLLALTDEVYEHLVYDGEHVPLASRAGMRERTVTVSSAGKTFSCTGWKIGWACAPPPLTDALRTTKQFLSFAGGTPLQHAVAVGLSADDAVFDEVRELHRRRRDLLVDALVAAGCDVRRPAGGYFATLDVRDLGHDDGEAFCRWAPGAIGVAAVPVSAFVRDPDDTVRPLVRLAFCKPEAVIEAGVDRLLDARRHATGGPR